MATRCQGQANVEEVSDEFELAREQRTKTKRAALQETRPSSKFQFEFLSATFQQGIGMLDRGLSQTRSWRRFPWILTALKNTLLPGDKLEDEKHPTPEDVLTHFLWGSPVFRAAIRDIDKVINRKDGKMKNKALVLCNSPKATHLFASVLEFMGVKVMKLTSTMS